MAGRNDWDKPAHTIIQGSYLLPGDLTLQPGNLQPDGAYDNAMCELLINEGYADATARTKGKDTPADVAKNEGVSDFLRRQRTRESLFQQLGGNYRNYR